MTIRPVALLSLILPSLALGQGVAPGPAPAIDFFPHPAVWNGSVLTSRIPFNVPGCYASGTVMGTHDAAVTTVRATAATYLDASGVLQTCAVGSLRVQGSPTVGPLIELAGTSLILLPNGIATGASVPSAGLGASGDFYLRTDTPGVANQRLYVNASGTWVGIL